jgi:hypothetical protein
MKMGGKEKGQRTVFAIPGSLPIEIENRIYRLLPITVL